VNGYPGNGFGMLLKISITHHCQKRLSGELADIPFITGKSHLHGEEYTRESLSNDEYTSEQCIHMNLTLVKKSRDTVPVKIYDWLHYSMGILNVVMK
jgi:hypothetical protein